MMADFHYRGIYIPQSSPNSTWHQFEIYGLTGDEPIGTYVIPIHPDQGNSMDEKIVLAHEKFAQALRNMADLAEGSGLLFKR
ncbi:hypothetical protein [Sphingobium yanoikuyae]|uniref:hypothetical protein n=1 Tax=Sphingobium yanoikuyae TaxID=13690 RepID=UPI0028DBCBF3|nr:hypothetical protein [Sphingobium yanoikuyae]